MLKDKMIDIVFTLNNIPSDEGSQNLMTSFSKLMRTKFFGLIARLISRKRVLDHIDHQNNINFRKKSYQ